MLQNLIRFSMNIPLNFYQIKLYSYLTFSQIPVKFNLTSLLGSSGLEPPTSRLSGARSNQLSYEPVCEACSTWYSLLFTSVSFRREAGFSLPFGFSSALGFSSFQDSLHQLLSERLGFNNVSVILPPRQWR